MLKQNVNQYQEFTRFLIFSLSFYLVLRELTFANLFQIA